MSGPSNDQDHPEPSPPPDDIPDVPAADSTPTPAADPVDAGAAHVHYDDDGNVIAEH